MESYDAIYQAVRSKISGGDISRAVQDHLHSLNLSHYAEMASRAAIDAANEQARPCVVYKPDLFLDGEHWCALFGRDLAVGVAGFGKSPAEAMYEFDKAWHASIDSRTATNLTKEK